MNAPDWPIPDRSDEAEPCEFPSEFFPHLVSLQAQR